MSWIYERKACSTNPLEFFEDMTCRIDLMEPMDVVDLKFHKMFDEVLNRKLENKVGAR